MGDLDELRRFACCRVKRARHYRRRARGAVVGERDDSRCDWCRQETRARWVAVGADGRVSVVRAIVKMSRLMYRACESGIPSVER